MRKLFVAALLVLFMVPLGFGQSSNARLGGTVQDASQALIPGVTVTATNTDTGVVTEVLSNATGTYNFPSLLPGPYTVSAELPGFQTQTVTDVRLGNAAQLRLNFTLAVAGAATEIEVSVSGDQLLLESSSSVGDVLEQAEVTALPIVSATGSDVLDLVRVMAGVNFTDNPLFGGEDTTFAGVSAANVQIQRDGIEAGAGGRWAVGVQGATIVNPDLVGEVRMILAPVDAEVGRGNAQIQVQTRSGSNEFHGAGVWDVRNTALEPNSWDNNRREPEAVPAPWFNDHEYTISLGGPIVQNKTHFFVLWDHAIPNARTDINSVVLTPCAANGIFRYYDNWNNGNFLQNTTGGGTPTIAVVDSGGNPVAPTENPNGTPHNGILRYASVFGQLANTPTAADCSDAVVTPGTNWDPNRVQVDPTGYITKVIDQAMPAANNWDIGDGLNTAGHRFLRSQTGIENRFGIAAASLRKQINVKIDHNFNEAHKVAWGYSYEDNYSSYSLPIWPSGFSGLAFREPQVMTVNFTSTLTPSLLNEARWGMRRTGTNEAHPLSDNAKPEERERALAWYPNVSGIPVFIQPGTAPISFLGGQPGGFAATDFVPGDVEESTRAYTFGDTVSWTRGTHAFRGGGEFRHSRSALAIDLSPGSHSTYARAKGGETQFSLLTGISSANIPGLAGTQTSGNNQAMRSLLNLLSGSIGQITELFWLGSSDSLGQWDDYRDAHQREREMRQNEYSFFLKDDWNVTPDLTLNLGMRWDYYGVPWATNGLTTSLVGGGSSLFGLSGTSFDDWMRGVQNGSPTELTFGGPGTSSPDILPFPQDKNNFGPAVGFSYRLPWGGAGQTTVRGGYQLTYVSQAVGAYENDLANPPGSSWTGIFDGGPGALQYIDLTDLAAIIPDAPPVLPMETIPVTARNVDLAAFDPAYQNPYIQNFTLAVTRNLARNLVLDVRYVGTMSRKLYGTIDLNIPNFLDNGLFEAFNAARYGGESALLDQMFAGVNVAGNGFGPVGTVFNGVMQTGAMHLRAAQITRTDLADGDYDGLANTLSITNAGLPGTPAGVNGALLRNSGLFPENFIKANPQLDNANYRTNLGNANYHSLQTQITLRPTAGLNLQVSHTWSRSLGRTGDFQNPADRSLDYILQGGHRRHDFRTYGTFKLPMGPNQLLFGDSAGVLARIVEGWNVSWIYSATTGAPGSIDAEPMLYGSGTADLVGTLDLDNAHVLWEDGAPFGTYLFPEGFSRVADPQCGQITTLQNLNTRCTLDAIADASGNIVLQTPYPGERGNLARNNFELPGSWKFDMSMGKRFQVRESVGLEFRLDALNIFNHPPPDTFTLNLNSGNFNRILEKGDLLTGGGSQFAGDLKRLFKLKVRIDF